MSLTPIGPKGPINATTAIAGSVIIYGTGVVRGADENTAIQAGANAEILGIATEAQDTIGHSFPFVGPGEIVECRSGAAFALDAKLTTDANGKLVTALSGNRVAAIAREAATAADLWVPVEVAPRGELAP